MHFVHFICFEFISDPSGAFCVFLVKKEGFSCIAQLVCFELTFDISGAFGAFGAFLVKTVIFYVYCKDFTRALLVHFVHLVCFANL